MRTVRAILAASALSLGAAPLLCADEFDAWILTHGRIQTLGHPAPKPLPVGSLQKPFLVRAWARSHAEATPKVTCTRTSLCWRPSGHGRLDLRAAIRESCNTYFKMLSADTPPGALRASFAEAGFSWLGEMTDAEAIGLPGPAETKVLPEQLIASYVDLVRTPWPAREEVRQEMLLGLKDAAQDGTASGLRLWGFLAKTGTVPALDRAPLKTSGFAMVLDEAGFAFFGLLRRGTGREAAIRAGAEIAKLRPGLLVRPAGAALPRRPAEKTRALDDPLRVEMLGELHLTEVSVKNIGVSPVDSSRGFIGPGATLSIGPGDRLSFGRWEIRSRTPSFFRRVHAALEVARKEGPLRLIATVTARDYANGILKAELGLASILGKLRTELAAAALRFAFHGPRHGEADVCDSTHCAWFVGDGPVPRWLRPDTAVNEKDMAAELSDDEWAVSIAAARDQPTGPDLWTADCGGDPASRHFIWGGPDRRVERCPRHPKGSGRLWRRDWPAVELSAIFGAQPLDMKVAVVDGQWFLRVKLSSRESPLGPPTVTALSYDQAHRRLASRLGWDALPAPALRVSRTLGGFSAEGTGFGHRVGLCLRP